MTVDQCACALNSGSFEKRDSYQSSSSSSSDENDEDDDNDDDKKSKSFKIGELEEVAEDSVQGEQTFVCLFLKPHSWCLELVRAAVDILCVLSNLHLQSG